MSLLNSVLRTGAFTRQVSAVSSDCYSGIVRITPDKLSDESLCRKPLETGDLSPNSRRRMRTMVGHQTFCRYRKAAFAAVISTILSLLPFRAEVTAQSNAVRVLYYPPWNISKLPMYLARDAGLFERAGLTVAWSDPGSNEKLLAGLKNGEADIAVVSAKHVIQNNATGGTRMTLVGNTGFNYSAFVAAPSIKTIRDLLGKKVGTGEPGSTPDQLTRLALRKLGIDPESDVTLVPLTEGRNSDRVKSLLSGEIAAMMVTAETLYTLEESGALARLHRLSDHKQLKIYAGGGADYAVDAAFLKSRREDVKKFMAGIWQGSALGGRGAKE